MDFSTLKITIKDEIKTGDLSLQMIFNRHIQVIEKFKNEGYTYAVIFKKIDSGLHEEHLRTLIRNAKKRLKTTTDTAVSINTHSNVQKNIVIVDKISDREWHNINVRSPYLIGRLNGLNIHPNEVKEWNCINELMVTKRMSEYKQ